MPRSLGRRNSAGTAGSASVCLRKNSVQHKLETMSRYSVCKSLTHPGKQVHGCLGHCIRCTASLLRACESRIDEAAGVRLPVSELACSIFFVFPRSAIQISMSSGRAQRLGNSEYGARIRPSFRTPVCGQCSDARAAFTLNTKKQKIAHPFEAGSTHVSRTLCTAHRLEVYAGPYSPRGCWGSTPRVRNSPMVMFQVFFLASPHVPLARTWPPHLATAARQQV
jgi:hypothetical protein